MPHQLLPALQARLDRLEQRVRREQVLLDRLAQQGLRAVGRRDRLAQERRALLALLETLDQLAPMGSPARQVLEGQQATQEQSEPPAQASPDQPA